MYILSFLVIINLIVFIHELGHFLFARFFGVKVESFSVGFGKSVVEWKDAKGTIWKLCILPLGGYVKMLENRDNDDGGLSFNKIERWKKFVIVIAGPLANYLLTFLVISFLYYTGVFGLFNLKVSNITNNSIASIIGFKDGDVIVSNNSKSITSFDISNKIELGRENVFEIIRNSKNISLELVTSNYDSIKTIEDIGLVVSPVDGRYVHSALSGFYGFSSTNRICTTILSKLSEMLTGKASSKDISSVIGTTYYFKKFFDNGFNSIMIFIALISINLCVLNLLPLPLLDGGHLSCYIVEWIIGRDLSDKFYKAYNGIGVVLIIIITVLTIVSDIIKFV